MTDAEILKEIKRLMESRMPTSITKPGTLRDCYLLVSGNTEFKPNPKFRPRARERIVVSSAWIKKRFGITC